MAPEIDWEHRALLKRRAITVGVVGLGQMGLGMACTLAARGFGVIGCDSSAERRDVAESSGIRIASLPELARDVGITVLSLPLATHVEAVVAGADGLIEHLQEGTVIIDTSTSEPGVSRRLAEITATRGIGFLDAPVSGGPAGAAAGTLTIMIGGADGDIAKARPVLEAMAANMIHVGGSGSGNIAKLVNNLLVAAHLLTVSEAVRLAESAGVPAGDVLKVVNAASGRSAVSEVNYPRWILSEAFDSGFAMGLMRKDVRLAAALATEMGCSLPMSELAAGIWRESAAHLGDNEDFNRIVTWTNGK